MTFTTYTAAQAATRARQYTSWRTGYCLNFVRNMLSPTVSSRYSLPDANHAWTYAQQKVYTGTPPAGAPVYWRSGVYGHIALSLGSGYCRSTDWPYKGSVGTVLISRMTSAWGITYRGWSRDYAGLIIRGLESGSTGGTTVTAPPPPILPYAQRDIDVSMVRPGARNEACRRYNMLLWARMSAGYRNMLYTQWKNEDANLYGPVAERVTWDLYNYLHRSAGWTVPSSRPCWPGPMLVRNIGGRPF